MSVKFYYGLTAADVDSADPLPSSITLSNIDSVTTVDASNGQTQPIRHIENSALVPIYVPLGGQPSTVTLSGVMKTAQSTFVGILPDNLLKVSTSSYAELPVGTYWELESSSTTRDVGYGALYRFNMTLNRQYHKDVR